MDKTKPTILYVDDEPSNLTVFTAAFRRYYNVLTSTSAANAMDILKNNVVDLIITDQRMPEMTGVQFLEAVIPSYPEPVRMILTGFSDIEAIIKAVNNGSVLRYIMKPWDVSELKQIIDIGVRIHQLEKNNRIMLEKLKVELDEQSKLINLFQKYVPLDVVKNITTDSSEELSLDGETRIVSVLFSDIRHFTPLSEKLDPKLLVSYLNKYFSIMVECVKKHEGTVYRFLGDGLYAIFGAPVSSVYNQRNAVLCALEMMEALKKFNQECGVDVNHQAEIGIGITTGEALVGHIVTEHFLSYVAIGNAVDKAITVEELTRELPNTILITKETYDQVNEDIKAEILSEHEMDGKKEKIYKVIGASAS